MKKWVALACLIALVVGMAVGHYAWSPAIARTETLTIYHAGSLAVPFQDLEAEFERTHPNVEVLCESGGSAAMINKSITREEAGEPPPNIIASSDYTLIPDRLYENYADWYIVFARNEMVLCYYDGAPHVDEIVNKTRTWYDVLRHNEVSYGHANPDDDPCGYRALMVIQLAQEYYHADGLYDALIYVQTPGDETTRGRINHEWGGGRKELVRSKSVDLIALLESGDLDYAFEYSSVAVQHGLNFIELDNAINLSQTGEMDGTGVTYEQFYSAASVDLQKSPTETTTVQGKAIVYGITIPKNAENPQLAMEFIALLLSDKGQEIMSLHGQPPIVPALCDHPEKLPMPIKVEES